VSDGFFKNLKVNTALIMSIYKDGLKFVEDEYDIEANFEQDIVDRAKTFFGPSSIYINAKRLLSSKALGGVIPDGFLIDFSDRSNPQFYVVEVELQKHDFYRHIFPQVTKFFAFFENTLKQKDLVEKLFELINENKDLLSDFRRFTGDREVYKSLSDLLDESKNILLIFDGSKSELPEILNTYTDTWGKRVRIVIIKKYSYQNEIIFTISPDFNEIEYFSEGSDPVDDDVEQWKISEDFHFEDSKQKYKSIYLEIKSKILEFDDTIIFNPQKYYISIRSPRNSAFIKIRAKNIEMVVMMNESEMKKRLRNHDVKSLSSSVQKFYNGQCASVIIKDETNLEEVVDLLKFTIEQNRNNN
jgi:predicted transport protein